MTPRTKTRILLLALSLAPLPAGGCAVTPVEPKRFEYTRLVMGVDARIILYAQSETTGRRAAEQAFERMIRLDATLSDYKQDSELALATKAAYPDPTPISADLYRVLSKAEAVAVASGGALDITSGPLIELWREARRTGRLPSRAALDAARARSGYGHLVLDGRGPTMQLLRSDVQIDLGAIGKGFAADEALALLKARGCPQALVDIGGDLAIGEAPPKRDTWRIALSTIDPDALPSLIPISNSGIAHSGDSEQFVEIEGARYSHIVDPRTGLALATEIAVTVIAPDAASADALASAISVLGPADGMTLLARFPGAMAFVEWIGDDGVERLASRGFPIPPSPGIRYAQ